MKADLKLSNTQLGLVFSAFAIPYALFQLIGGWIGDKFGPRLTLSVCCALVGVSTILTGAAQGIRLAFRAASGIGVWRGRCVSDSYSRDVQLGACEELGIRAGDHCTRSRRLGNAITPPIMAALLLFISWRGSFVVLGLLSLLWLFVWAWYFRNDPGEHPAITEAELAELPAIGSGSRKAIPWRPLARRILPVTIVDFCYGWTLWLFLSWIPTFFFENYHLNLQSSAMFSGGVLFAGVIGDTVGGLASDRLLRMTGSLVVARRSVIVTGFLGAFVFLVPVVLIHDLRIAAIGLSLAFFFAELIVAPIWSIPMDIAPRYAGSASGMMNFGFAVAGLVSPSSFGYLVDRTGSWVVPFIGSIALLLLGAALAMRLRPDKPFVDAIE